MQGIGKPEPLKHGKSGLFSRRIDETNRLVYDIDESQNIRILSCKGHYEDKENKFMLPFTHRHIEISPRM